MISFAELQLPERQTWHPRHRGAARPSRTRGRRSPSGLRRDEEELKKTLDDTVNRRNDIVHRADREKKTPDGDAQEIGYAWTRQAVDTIRVVCLCLDELVDERLSELRMNKRRNLSRREWHDHGTSHTEQIAERRDAMPQAARRSGVARASGQVRHLRRRKKDEVQVDNDDRMINLSDEDRGCRKDILDHLRTHQGSWATSPRTPSPSWSGRSLSRT